VAVSSPAAEERAARQRERNLERGRAKQARERAQREHAERRRLLRETAADLRDVRRRLAAADAAYGRALKHPDLRGLEEAGALLRGLSARESKLKRTIAELEGAAGNRRS
jgi:hypothetical protein